MNKDAALRLVSIGGSVASIVALLIVLLQLVAERASVPAQYMVWRLLLAGIALVCAAGVAMFTFQYCQEVLQGQKPARAKTWRVFLSVGVALLFVAVCLDGFFAALYWVVWLQPIFILRQLF